MLGAPLNSVEEQLLIQVACGVGIVPYNPGFCFPGQGIVPIRRLFFRSSEFHHLVRFHKLLIVGYYNIQQGDCSFLFEATYINHGNGSLPSTSIHSNAALWTRRARTHRLPNLVREREWSMAHPRLSRSVRKLLNLFATQKN